MRRIAPVVRRYSIPQAILNLLLSLWLVHPLGMLGVALGTLLPVLLLQYTFMAFILKELDLGWRDVWISVVRPTAAPALVASAPCLAVWVWLGPQSFWLVPAAAASSALYAAIFWSGMQANERADLLSHVPGPLRAVLAA
jgi:O-antigen/teichoic acid export membrane protein